MRTFLTNFNIFLPPNAIGQTKTLDWLQAYHQFRTPDKRERIEKFVKKFGVSSDLIATRRSFISDFLNLEFEKNSLFTNEIPNLTERSQFAQKTFESVFEHLYRNRDRVPEQLLHVSCTHYESPSAAQKLVIGKEWFDKTTVTHLYHMGCYAALPAVRTAHALNCAGNNFVDIVHTEMCSLHLNDHSYSPEQLVVQSLFSDGSIQYSAVSENQFQGKGMELLAQKEILVPGTEEDMTWRLSSDRFDMTLSKNVPKYLGERLEEFFKELFAKADLDYTKEKDSSLFAIHPGGPKIIDLSQQALQLSEEQVKYSKQTLKTRGNMSSATLPHIWESMLVPENDQKLVATVAFGPGLTMTGALLKICS